MNNKSYCLLTCIYEFLVKKTTNFSFKLLWTLKTINILFERVGVKTWFKLFSFHSCAVIHYFTITFLFVQNTIALHPLFNRFYPMKYIKLAKITVEQQLRVDNNNTLEKQWLFISSCKPYYQKLTGINWHRWALWDLQRNLTMTMKDL